MLGIDRQAECQANDAAAELGIAPPVAAMLETRLPRHRVREGREDDRGGAAGAGNAGGSGPRATCLPRLGTQLPTSFDSFRLVEDYARRAREHGASRPRSSSRPPARARDIQAALQGPEHAPVACHNDLLAANFLHDGERVQIVDWEYAGMGDRYFDLANFAVNNELVEDDAERLLDAYFGEPADDRRRASLNLFRFMSDFREAMWGVVQTGRLELDFDFAATPRSTSSAWPGRVRTALRHVARRGADSRPRAPGLRPLRDRGRRRGGRRSPTTWPSSATRTSSWSTATS